MSSIDYLNYKFFSLKLCIKYKFINHVINNIWLIQNLTYLLRAKRACNLSIQQLDFQNM